MKNFFESGVTILCQTIARYARVAGDEVCQTIARYARVAGNEVCQTIARYARVAGSELCWLLRGSSLQVFNKG